MTRRTVRRGEGGLTSTELAVLMPVVIALVLVPFQVALWWHANHVANAAAQEAVESAQVADATEADGVAAAQWMLSQAGHLTHTEIAVRRTADAVTAEVSGQAPRLLFSWRVNATATGPIERFVAPGAEP